MGFASPFDAMPAPDGLLPVSDFFERHMQELEKGRAILEAGVNQLEETLKTTITTLIDRIADAERRIEALELGGSEDWKRGISADGDDD